MHTLSHEKIAIETPTEALDLVNTLILAPQEDTKDMLGFAYPSNSKIKRVSEKSVRAEIISQLRRSNIPEVRALIRKIGIIRFANLMLAISWHESNRFMLNIIENRTNGRVWGDYGLFQLNLDTYDQLRKYSEDGDKSLLTSIRRNVESALKYFDEYWYNQIANWSSSMGWEKAIIKSWNSAASYESYIGKIYPKYLDYMKKYPDAGLRGVEKFGIFGMCSLVIGTFIYFMMNSMKKGK